MKWDAKIRKNEQLKKNIEYPQLPILKNRIFANKKSNEYFQFQCPFYKRRRLPQSL